MPIRHTPAQRGHTWDPWPCCKSDVETHEWYRGRPRKEIICSDCLELIRLGKDARRRASDAGEKPFKWTSSPHNWPGYYGHYNFRAIPDAKFGGPYHAGEILRLKMFELVIALSHLSTENPWLSKADPVLTCDKTSLRIGRYESTTLVTMDPIVQKALDAFDGGIREALESAYREGKERGQNILLNLAKNELSVNDFNRQTAKDADE